MQRRHLSDLSVTAYRLSYFGKNPTEVNWTLTSASRNTFKAKHKYISSCSTNFNQQALNPRLANLVTDPLHPGSVSDERTHLIFFRLDMNNILDMSNIWHDYEWVLLHLSSPDYGAISKNNCCCWQNQNVVFPSLDECLWFLNLWVKIVKMLWQSQTSFFTVFLFHQQPSAPDVRRLHWWPSAYTTQKLTQTKTTTGHQTDWYLNATVSFVSSFLQRCQSTSVWIKDGRRSRHVHKLLSWNRCWISASHITKLVWPTTYSTWVTITSTFLC